MGRESMHREAIQALHCDRTKGRSEVTNDGLGRASLDAHVEKIIGERRGGARLQSEVIRVHQRSSEFIRGHQSSSEVIRGHQRSSEVIRSTQRYSELACRSHPTPVHVTDESVACVCDATRGEGAVVSTYMQGRVHLRFEARAARLGRDDRVEPFGHHRARVRAQDGAREVGGCLPNGAVHEAARDECHQGQSRTIKGDRTCRTELYMRLRATTAVSAAATRARPV
mgnify:CR=1 FL=1